MFTPSGGSTALVDTSPEEEAVELGARSASPSLCVDGEGAPPPVLSLEDHLEEHRLSMHIAAARLRAVGLTIREEWLP